MEINDTTMMVTRFSQLLGFAPYTIIRNKLNQIVDFKLNRALCVYAAALMLGFSISSNYALLYDSTSGHALR